MKKNIMYTYIYTKTLDNADGIVVKALDFENEDDAVDCFNDKVKALVEEAFNNKFLQFKMSMHEHKALIQIEGVHHCIAIVKDGGLLQDE